MSIHQSSPSNSFLPANAPSGLLIPLPSSRLIYQLEIKQNPKHSRMSGMGLKAERRPLDPPPIIQLKIHDENEQDITKGMLIDNPYFMLQATLTSADGAQDLISLTDNTTGTLLGDTVSSLYPLRDLVNMEGAYFCFANLSVRLEGLYRLKYHLVEMTPEGVKYHTSIFSEPFQVYPPKLFPGVEESTLTSLKYANMGLKLRVRKETRAKKIIKLDPQSESEEQNNFTLGTSSSASSPLHSVATPEPLNEQSSSPTVVKHKMSLSFILSCGDSETTNETKVTNNYFQQFKPSAMINTNDYNYYYNYN